MKRTLVLVVALAGGCKITNDPQLKQHSAEAHTAMAALRAKTEAFVQKNGRCPKAGEVERVADPWGRAYIVVCPGQKGHAADVVSKGPDGDVGTTDDVRSWD
ncbi:MAG TPA: type II secretion system protein GspG [Polyangia bacterium]|nr:type II secretion system protein GspG [Polyangia bacterium]